MQIYCHNKCGVILEEFNPHLPFGEFFGGSFFHFLQGQEIFYKKIVVYIVYKDVQKSGFIFNSNL